MYSGGNPIQLLHRESPWAQSIRFNKLAYSQGGRLTYVIGFHLCAKLWSAVRWVEVKQQSADRCKTDSGSVAAVFIQTDRRPLGCRRSRWSVHCWLLLLLFYFIEFLPCLTLSSCGQPKGKLGVRWWNPTRENLSLLSEELDMRNRQREIIDLRYLLENNTTF